MAQSKWLWIGILAAIVVAVYLFKSQITALFAKSTTTTGTSTTGTTTTTTSTGTSKYPVTIRSAPADILSAFSASGYMAQLQAMVNSGAYPQSYITQATSDPAGWLAAHPYLYTAYPTYFKQST